MAASHPLAFTVSPHDGEGAGGLRREAAAPLADTPGGVLAPVPEGVGLRSGWGLEEGRRAQRMALGTTLGMAGLAALLLGAGGALAARRF